LIETIEGCVQHSNRILGDLLDYSRKPRLKFDEANLEQLLNQALSTVKIPRDVTIRSTVNDLQTRLDTEMMRRVFVNIIANAVEAMPKGGELLIEAHETNGTLGISFTDTGTGFSNEALENLWKPLNTTKPHGSGLGLAICKRIVEAHNGTIALKTTQGKGSTFTITLPPTPRD